MKWMKENSQGFLNLLKQNQIKLTIVSETALKGETNIITDVAGKEILYDRIESPFQQIDLSNFTSGIYFMTVNGNSTVISIANK